MKQLLLVAHGSRSSVSNDEIIELTATLRGKGDFFFDRIDCAFLEFAEPGVAESIDQAVSQGVQEILLLPYFLAAGVHVSRDLPAIAAAKRSEHAGVKIGISAHFGASSGIGNLLLTLAAAAS
ncbi:MAG: CbiX/SirB N-terminal domain-containing protein [Gammaproteobacteria bacterium]|nr:CbiX/SirB N-terminal domain-containing protein [Gammaproteobacteria bacterium]